MNLINSKKFQAAIIGVVVMVAAEVGLDIDPAALATIVSPFIAFIVGQGVADIGKEKAKVESENKE